MLEVYFLVRTFDYLTLILFAHYIKQLFRNVFTMLGLIFALLFWRNDFGVIEATDILT